VKTAADALQLGASDRLRWAIHQLEVMDEVESRAEKRTREFKDELNWMGETGDAADEDVSAYLQSTFTGKSKTLSKMFGDFRKSVDDKATHLDVPGKKRSPQRKWKLAVAKVSNPFKMIQFNQSQTKMSAEALQALGNIDSWGTDLFNLESLSAGRPLVATGLQALENLGLNSRLNIDPATCTKFFTAVEEGYAKFPAVPYHNNLHGTDVLLTTYQLLQTDTLKDLFTDLELLAAILASAAHDLGHPGVNNTFLQVTEHETAIMYNDISVLENFHAASASRLLAKAETNILAHLDRKDAKFVRNLMMGMILGTDMAKHVEHLNNFKTTMIERVKEVESIQAQLPPGSPVPVPAMDDTHRIFVLDAIVHLADLSGPTKPWELSKTWSARVLKEFYEQGDQERALGIPMEPLNDGSKVNVAKGQKGFISYVVAPLWAIWEDFHLAGFPEDRAKCIPVQNMEDNVAKWEAMIADGDVEGHTFVNQVLGSTIPPAASGSPVERPTIAVSEA
jgi:hypothetical protein